MKAEFMRHILPTKDEDFPFQAANLFSNLLITCAKLLSCMNFPYWNS